jgi:glucose-6-phosphate isomerase
MYALDQSVTWEKLEALAAETSSDQISDYFKDDPSRFDNMSLRLGELFLDYSKNKISDEVLASLLQLAEHSPLYQRRAQMFSGDIAYCAAKPQR